VWYTKPLRENVEVVVVKYPLLEVVVKYPINVYKQMLCKELFTPNQS